MQVQKAYLQGLLSSQAKANRGITQANDYFCVSFTSVRQWLTASELASINCHLCGRVPIGLSSFKPWCFCPLCSCYLWIALQNLDSACQLIITLGSCISSKLHCNSDFDSPFQIFSALAHRHTLYISPRSHMSLMLMCNISDYHVRLLNADIIVLKSNT